jgi:hypothetical protein
MLFYHSSWAARATRREQWANLSFELMWEGSMDGSRVDSVGNLDHFKQILSMKGSNGIVPAYGPHQILEAATAEALAHMLLALSKPLQCIVRAVAPLQVPS